MNEFYASFASYYPGQFASAKVGQLHRLLHLTPQSENKKIAKIWDGGTMGERVKECFKHFSDEQANAIITYLHWKLLEDKDNLTIEQALQNYWIKRTENYI